MAGRAIVNGAKQSKAAPEIKRPRLETEGIDTGTDTPARRRLDFRGRQQRGSDALLPHVRRDDKHLDFEPPEKCRAPQSTSDGAGTVPDGNDQQTRIRGSDDRPRSRIQGAVDTVEHRSFDGIQDGEHPYAMVLNRLEAGLELACVVLEG